MNNNVTCLYITPLRPDLPPFAPVEDAEPRDPFKMSRAEVIAEIRALGVSVDTKKAYNRLAGQLKKLRAMAANFAPIAAAAPFRMPTFGAAPEGFTPMTIAASATHAVCRRTLHVSELADLESSVNAALAEKDKEIERLKERVLNLEAQLNLDLSALSEVAGLGRNGTRADVYYRIANLVEGDKDNSRIRARVAELESRIRNADGIGNPSCANVGMDRIDGRLRDLKAQNDKRESERDAARANVRKLQLALRSANNTIENLRHWHLDWRIKEIAKHWDTESAERFPIIADPTKEAADDPHA